jgi:drug/metabolite transporter (DMT)-like permease
MILALAAAAAAALGFGLASVVQQVGVRRAPGHSRISLRFAGDLASEPLFLLGTGLDAAGFLLTFLALRTLPVFAVEAMVASAVAVTALAAGRWLGDTLAAPDRAAIGVVVVGLALVALSARPGSPPAVGTLTRVALVAGVPALLAAGGAVSRWRSGPVAVALGGLSGVAFGAFAVAGRVVTPGAILTDPLAWCAAAYCAVGLLLYGAALQRGPVTVVAAATTGLEALVPAAAGLAIADGARAGFGPVAAVGFILTIAAVLVLARRAPAAEVQDHVNT